MELALHPVAQGRVAFLRRIVPHDEAAHAVRDDVHPPRHDAVAVERREHRIDLALERIARGDLAGVLAVGQRILLASKARYFE